MTLLTGTVQPQNHRSGPGLLAIGNFEFFLFLSVLIDESVINLKKVCHTLYAERTISDFDSRLAVLPPRLPGKWLVGLAQPSAVLVRACHEGVGSAGRWGLLFDAVLERRDHKQLQAISGSVKALPGADLRG